MSDDFDLGGYLRRARRLADLSQRDLADLAKVRPSLVARLEASRGANPTLATLIRLLAAAGCRLQVCDADGRVLAPFGGRRRGVRDRAGREFPAHHDVRTVLSRLDWWGGGSTVDDPPVHTFDRSREMRDWMRGWQFFPPLTPDPREPPCDDRAASKAEERN